MSDLYYLTLWRFSNFISANVIRFQPYFTRRDRPPSKMHFVSNQNSKTDIKRMIGTNYDAYKANVNHGHDRVLVVFERVHVAESVVLDLIITRE